MIIVDEIAHDAPLQNEVTGLVAARAVQLAGVGDHPVATRTGQRVPLEAKEQPVTPRGGGRQHKQRKRTRNNCSSHRFSPELLHRLPNPVPPTACIQSTRSGWNNQDFFGPPETFTDVNGPDFTAAALQCDPYFTDWGTSDIHIYGAEIVPASSYESWIAAPGWDTNVSHCGMATLADANAKWGDVVPTLTGGPNIKNVTAMINTFLGNALALPAYQAQIIPNVPVLAGSTSFRATSFKEIYAVLRAFLGDQYTAQTGVSGPCLCPSSVTCGATACTSDSDCSGGLCIDLLCTDACGRCAP